MPHDITKKTRTVFFVNHSSYSNLSILLEMMMSIREPSPNGVLSDLDYCPEKNKISCTEAFALLRSQVGSPW